ncbi:MAG: hypothetical protein HY049_10395 [Acidobacteria bacterium]|nr:hypothetical protein [Acidobacteriota bacterium]
MSGVGAILRFHLGVGVRLASHAAAPLVGVAVAWVGLAEFPGDVLAAVAQGLAAPGSDPAASWTFAVVLLALATWAAPRVTTGLGGWIRHLPASATSHRRAALLALAASQLPAVVASALLAGGLVVFGHPVSLAKLAAIPLLAFGAATVALPVRRRALASALGAAAILLALSPGWMTLPAALAALAAADRLSGSIAPPALARRRRTFARAPLLAVIAWRAVGFRTATALAIPIMVLGLAALFLANNAVTPAVASGAVRFGGLLAAAILMSGVAAEMGLRRPVWPWARSLPWSSSRRVAADALFLGVPALPLVLVAAVLDPPAALAVLATTPLLALRAASALRRAQSLRIGAMGVILVEGFVVAGLAGLVPWGALLFAAATPLALRAAARAERELPVSRWIALHHAAAGDPLSWSAK